MIYKVNLLTPYHMKIFVNFTEQFQAEIIDDKVKIAFFPTIYSGIGTSEATSM